MSEKILAFDFGASSGRAMLGELKDGKIQMQEIHRFSNDPVLVNGTLHWDILRLFFEIKQGILKAKVLGGFNILSIDTWGVDFGIINHKGDLIENPVHYRDKRTDGIIDYTFKTISQKDLYMETGNQIMNFNTIFQIMSLIKNKSEVLKYADKILLIPDLLIYFLTGNISAEYSIASTTGLLNPTTKTWNYELMEKLDIDKSLFPEIVQSGTLVGDLSDEICEELGCNKAKVIKVAQHDTASAVLATPSCEKDFIYISCGTWSLFGTELDNSIVNQTTMKLNLTNEGGFNNTTRLLKNIMGLWLIQQSKAYWVNQGEQVTYGDLEQEALKSKPFKCFIDPDHLSFVAPGNIPKKVCEFCEQTGQYIPKTRSEITRCIYESLSFKYKYAFEQIKSATSKNYNSIHIIGGGTKDNFLCQLTANACNAKVIAGPVEATVIGNITASLLKLGEIQNIDSAREIIKNSFQVKSYNPEYENCEDYDLAYKRFVNVLNKSSKG